MVRRVAVACVAGARRSGERERSDRVFRDIHGAEYHRHPDIVLVDRRAGGNRPATTTFFGDTGLWFVPTGGGPAHGKWSRERLSARHQLRPGLHERRRFRRHVRRSASRTAPRSSGRSSFDTRIDRDVRPLFIANDTAFGGVIDRYPRVNQYWTGDNVGDFYLGAKVQSAGRSTGRSRRRSRCAGMVKLPTGDDGRRASAPGKTGLLGRRHRQQGSAGSWSKSRATAATSGAGSRTASTRRAARSAGAPASAFPSRSSLRVHRAS